MDTKKNMQMQPRPQHYGRFTWKWWNETKSDKMNIRGNSVQLYIQSTILTEMQRIDQQKNI